MAESLSRRALFARFRGGPAQLRPPWALDETSFSDRCTACARCIEACPEGILSAGHGGLPIVTFSRGACTFCAACADACPEACFTPEREGRPWLLVASVSPACIETRGVACRMCEGACDLSAIRFRPRIGGGSNVLIDVETCSGCGACLSPCPVGALSVGEPRLEEARS